MTTIFNLDTQQNQYFYDSGYSTTPSPGSSSTSSRMMASPMSQISDTQTSLQFLNLLTTEESFSNNVFDTPLRMTAMRDPNPAPTLNGPQLVILEQPVDKFRFRYKSEMHGTHGSLMGARNEKSKKTFPTVELRGYNGKAVIRCSLYQTDGLYPTPHSHKLVVRHGDMDISDPHDVFVSKEEGFRAIFQGMGIIHTAKKHIVEELIAKKRKEKKFELNRQLTTREETQIKLTAESEAKSMNLNQVCLGFQAFAVDNDDSWRKICEPVFSKQINNMKSALTGELKISRLSAAVSSAAGGEDLFLFVEKVGKKNIKVRFFEVDENDDTVWEGWGNFSEADVHHQYAIALRTPPYQNINIDRNVDVYIQLIRPSDSDTSEPMPFKYKPRDVVTSRKRARTSSSFSSSELPEPIVKGVRSNFQDIQQNPITISKEFNGSQIIDDLMQSGITDPNSKDTFLQQVQMDSDELLNIMDSSLMDSSLMDFGKFETDGVSVQSKNLHKQSTSIPALSMPRNEPQITFNTVPDSELYVNDFKTILSIYRTKWQTEPEKAKSKILEIFYEANSNNEDILHNAIACGNTKAMINILPLIDKLQIYQVLQIQNERKETCLHIACLFDKPEYLRPLINLGANPNIPNDRGNTALHIAVEENLIMCASKILDKKNYTKKSHNLQIDLVNDEGLTPLHLAVKKRNLPMIQKLLEIGGASTKLCISKNGNNLLHIAIEQNDESIVKYLLESTPVKVNELNSSGFTPLRLAQSMEKVSNGIIRLLIKHGAANEKNKMDCDWIELRKDEMSSNDGDDDDDDDKQLTIDENQRKSTDNDDADSDKIDQSIVLDEECMKKLSAIFNNDKKWEKLALHLNLVDYVRFWRTLGNPTKYMLNFIRLQSSDGFNMKILLDALKTLNETEAIQCIKNMKTKRP